MQFIPRSIQILTLSLALAAGPALADPDHWGHGGPGWHGGRDHWGGDGWRRGSWNHGWHDGRLGWWWVVGGLWTFYPAPIYPYPPAVVVESPAPVLVEHPALAIGPGTSGDSWYYCRSSKGYYPYVSSCPGGWERIAPTPPDARP